jgi:thymidylate synthase
MSRIVARNISHATAISLADALSHGGVIHVRGEEVRELRNRVTVLEQPLERCVFLRYRNNDIFAALAETLWVLAGRDDVAWLGRYLPRAPEFSDDGLVWRAAYGPRLRNWSGTDQLACVRQLLLDELATRRAVMSLYDPGRDFVVSKDIPCNNWLHWLVRDGRLHLNIAVRSNDIVWGFSGANSFGWSVLHDLMANWTGVPVGEATYFASSLHLYARHYRRAEKIVSSLPPVTCYDFGIESVRFITPWEQFDQVLSDWFESERRMSESPSAALNALGDPFLDHALRLLRLKHGEKLGWDNQKISEELAALPTNDFTAAAYEYFGRTRPGVLESITEPRLARFFEAYHQEATTLDVLPMRIKRLHAAKDAAYGDAWKKRGEIVGVLANIARKVDRLEVFAAKRTLLPGESLLDTVVDLFVYATKYRLFLMEANPQLAAGVLPEGAPRPFSNSVANFDNLVDATRFDALNGTMEDTIVRIIATFADLQAKAETGAGGPGERMALACTLGDLSAHLAASVAASAPQALEAMAQF